MPHTSSQRFRKMLLQETCAVPFFCQKLMLRHTFLKNSDAGPRDSVIPGFVGWWALSLGLSWDIWDAPKMAARINGKIWKDESWWSTMRFSDTLRWLGRLRVSDEKGISFASAMPSTFKSTVNAGSDEDTSVDKPGNTKRNDAFCWEYSNWLFRFCVNVLHRSPSAFGLYTLTPAQPTTNIDQYHCWESDLIPGKHSKCSGGFMHCAFTTIILKPLKPCRTEATSPRIPCPAWGSPSAQTSEALRRP